MPDWGWITVSFSTPLIFCYYLPLRFGGRMPLLLFIFHIFHNIHTYIHSITFIQYIYPSPFAGASLHLLIAWKLSGKTLPVVPSRESNLGLPYSKSTLYQLSHAAPLKGSVQPDKNRMKGYYRIDIKYVLTMNVPVVYMARDITFWMQENPFRGPLEGVGPESQDFFGPWKDNERSECHLCPKKSVL